MVQNQMADYIGAQFKAGVSRETIRAALIGVGWETADIDDTLQKVESDIKTAAAAVLVSPAMPLTSPISVAASMPAMKAQTKPIQPISVASPMGVSVGTSAGSSFGAKPAVSPLGPGTGPVVAARSAGAGSFSPMDVMGGVATGARPVSSGMNQPVRPSFGAAANNPFGTSKGAAKVDAFAAGARFNTSSPTVAQNAGQMKVSHTGERVSMVAEAVGLVALAALSIYFYTQNSALGARVNALSAAGPAAASPDLVAQDQALTVTNGTLTAQVTALTAQTADLKTQLSFFAVPPQSGTSSAPVVVTGSISGILSTSTNNKGIYSLRTSYDIVIFVRNATDPKVVALLKPLVGAPVTLEGSFVMGSGFINVTSVNGNLVNPLTIVATSTTATTTTTTATVTTVTTTTVTTSGQ